MCTASQVPRRPPSPDPVASMARRPWRNPGSSGDNQCLFPAASTFLLEYLRSAPLPQQSLLRVLTRLAAPPGGAVRAGAHGLNTVAQEWGDRCGLPFFPPMFTGKCHAGAGEGMGLRAGYKGTWLPEQWGIAKGPGMRRCCCPRPPFPSVPAAPPSPMSCTIGMWHRGCRHLFPLH
jgi:hypothetical protein